MRAKVLGALLVLASLLAPAASASPPEGAGPAVDEEVAAAAAQGDGPVGVIVTFQADPAPVEVLAADAGVEEVDHAFPTIQAVAAEVDQAELADLADDPRVASIELDLPVAAALDTARAAIGVPAMVAQFGLTGDGDGNPAAFSTADVTVAVIDTGINALHQALDEGKVREHRNFGSCASPTGSDWDDSSNGHGSNVAGIIAGDGDGGVLGVTGVAPAAWLLDLKVLCNGEGSQSGIMAALNWVLGNRSAHGIDVVNLSLSLKGCGSDGLDGISRLVNQVVAAGVVVSAAAGNAGTCPGSGELGTITSPGSAAYAMAVGNVADPTDTSGLRRGWRVSELSLRGPTTDGRIKPDFVAPGTGILSAAGDGTQGRGSLTGTSMASAMLAGLAGLVVELNDGARPSGSACASCATGVVDASMRLPIRDLLRRTALDWGTPGPDNDSGWGIIDAYRVVNLVSAGTGQSPPARACASWARGSLASGGSETWTLVAQGGGFPVTVTTVLPSAALHSIGLGPISNGGVARSLSLSVSAVAGQSVPLTVSTGGGPGFGYVLEISGAARVVRNATGRLAATCVPLAAGRYTPAGPSRALDTRITGGPLGTGETRTVSLVAAGVPATATAVVLNVTATDSASAGYLTVFPGGVEPPATSTVNLFTPRQVVANAALVGLGPNATVSIYNFASPTHAVLDVYGYYTATGGTGAGFVPVAPNRLVDTRTTGGAIGPGLTRRFTVAPGAVPVGTAAVVLNVTVTQPTSSGFVSLYPNAWTGTSNLNFTAGQTIANLVTVPLRADGTVEVLNRGGSTHVILDVMGYYRAGEGAAFVPVLPARVLDTRNGTGGWLGMLDPSLGTYLDVTDVGGVPAAGVTAIALNVTATEATGQTHVTVWPSDQAFPPTSNLNSSPGATTPNLVTVGVGAYGFVWAHAPVRTHLLADITGYFG